MEYFDTETLEMRKTEMFVEGYQAGLVKDMSYKGLWKVSFTLKEFELYTLLQAAGSRNKILNIAYHIDRNE